MHALRFLEQILAVDGNMLEMMRSEGLWDLVFGHHFFFFGQQQREQASLKADRFI
jgi:hypothetical protein